MTNLVIPDPDSLGIRVTPHTPLGHLVAVLRRANPGAPYAVIKATAEDIRRRRVKPAAAAPESGNGIEPVDVEGKAAEAAAVEPKVERAVVAQWAAGVGMDWSGRGRIPAQILKAYRDAHREEILASMVPVEGGSPIPAEPPPATR